MSALASLERFGEEDPFFHKLKIVQTRSEWPLASDLFAFEYPHDIQHSVLERI